MRLQGRIVYYIPARRFGFILTPDGKEFFFHRSDVTPGEPVLSQDVEFEIAPPIKEGKGPRAVNVKLIATDADVAVLSGGVK